MSDERAFSLPEWDVAAYSIIFSEFAGNKFDWNAMRYVERE